MEPADLAFEADDGASLANPRPRREGHEIVPDPGHLAQDQDAGQERRAEPVGDLGVPGAEPPPRSRRVDQEFDGGLRVWPATGGDVDGGGVVDAYQREELPDVRTSRAVVERNFRSINTLVPTAAPKDHDACDP